LLDCSNALLEKPTCSSLSKWSYLSSSGSSLYLPSCFCSSRFIYET